MAAQPEVPIIPLHVPLHPAGPTGSGPRCAAGRDPSPGLGARRGWPRASVSPAAKWRIGGEGWKRWGWRGGSCAGTCCGFPVGPPHPMPGFWVGITASVPWGHGISPRFVFDPLFPSPMCIPHGKWWLPAPSSSWGTDWGLSRHMGRGDPRQDEHNALLTAPTTEIRLLIDLLGFMGLRMGSYRGGTRGRAAPAPLPKPPSCTPLSA